jgi:hypothetical protein
VDKVVGRDIVLSHISIAEVTNELKCVSALPHALSENFINSGRLIFIFIV